LARSSPSSTTPTEQVALSERLPLLTVSMTILYLVVTKYLPVVCFVTVTVIPLFELAERDRLLSAGDELLERLRPRLLDVLRRDIPVCQTADNRIRHAMHAEKQHVKTCAVQATGLSVSAQE